VFKFPRLHLFFFFGSQMKDSSWTYTVLLLAHAASWLPIFRAAVLSRSYADAVHPTFEDSWRQDEASYK
jgi:hypothetical protein